jgi:YVTN family beta-propeller protein
MKTTAAVLFTMFTLYGAETPSPALLVLNKEDATLAIVDPGTSKVVARIPTGEGPHEIAVSADGKLAFVGNYGAQTPGKTACVIDLVEQKERRLDLGPLRRPHGVAFADGKFYFTAEVNKAIGRYDPAANQVDWILGTGQNVTHMVLVSKDLSRIFTANIGSDTISILERGSNPLNWNQTVVPVGKGPEAMDMSPDGKEIWTSHSRDGGVSIIDIASKKVTGTLDLHTKRSNRLKFTPDGKHVLITDLDAGELLVLDTASKKEIKRLKMGRAPEGILIVPDGSRAYIGVAGDNHLAVVDLKTWEISGQIETGRGPDGMAWAVR